MKKIQGLYGLPESATYDEMDSPVGRLTILTSSDGLHAILWDIDDRRSLKHETLISNFNKSTDEVTLLRTKAQLDEYFKGKRRVFDLPLVINGTVFQRQVWEQLLKIPYATTISYAIQAERVGNKNKARAVGMANGLNPIPIIVPCHRVVGSNGNLVGFAGGIARKQWLLNHEKVNIHIE